jgi:hypothetical protein
MSFDCDSALIEDRICEMGCDNAINRAADESEDIDMKDLLEVE